MGMFDSFIVDLVCPDCGEHINEIQSKKFDCMLQEFKIGDAVVSDSWVHLYDVAYVEDAYCKCEDGLWTISIKDNRFVGVSKYYG